MGIHKKDLDLIDLSLLAQNKVFQGLNMCELGSQALRGVLGSKFKNPKEYFQSLDCSHTSIDMNGERGALKINLNHDLEKTNPMFTRYFDMVTNFGTSEHVFDQYQCWKNIHNLLKFGGSVVSSVPEVNSWPNHCQYYYDLEFFQDLCKMCDYKIVKNTVYENNNGKKLLNLVECIFIKQVDIPFVSREDFASLTITKTGFEDPSQWGY
jgi:hypothetical protein